MTVPVSLIDSAHAYEASLTVTAEGIAGWRREVVALLGRWGVSPEAEGVIRLGVSELLSNVVRHCPTRRCRLCIVRVGPDVVVHVFDESRCLPKLPVMDQLAEDGRGLWLLREMADAFGFMPKQYVSDAGPALGKIVWFACWGAVPREKS
ncbi:ATP-binding protein [Streptomyces sp. NBRC 109706]|uniref:ATP-binding protein n=1 Tax=Streptomyces sp. NBRC 109706 TaxID=1550035 RepID=UPI000783A031|nr:ATP-binding protein [Streptomyces sp. NBRC 109706]